MNTANT